MRAERIQILRQIDALDEKRCVKCHASSAYNTAQCDCEAATAIRVLGGKLIKLTNARCQDAMGRLEDVGLEGLTVEIYKKAKTTGVTDKEIYKTLKISQMSWLRWKRAAGLILKPRELV